MLQKIILEFHESKIEGIAPFATKNLFSKSFNPLSFSKKYYIINILNLNFLIL